MSESNQQLTLPVAIVIAGLLIAGAVFLSRPVERGTGSMAAPNVFFEQPLADLDIDTDTFYACLNDAETQQAVIDDTEEVLALGGNGTPYSVIVTPEGTLYAISGAIPYSGAGDTPGFKDQLDAIMDGTTDLVPLAADVAANFRPVTNDDLTLANPNGTYTIVEYSDFECPFCGRHHPTLERIVTEDSNVRWVYRHFPLVSIHPQATAAALAGECIAAQAGNEGFTEYADFIFKNQRLLQTAPYQG